MQKRSRLILILVVFAVSLTGLALYGHAVAYRYFLRQTIAQSDASLRLVSAGLSGALQRFEPIPSLLADRGSIRWILSTSASDGDTDQVDQELKEIALRTGASDIYVMNADGLTIAASNFDQDTTFIGKNYKFRPYFQDAMAGKTGRYFALGTASLKRGVYFSAPVLRAGQPIGVLAVKFTVDEFEKDWKGFNHELIVTDQDNIIFMSSRPEWLFNALGPLTPETRRRLQESRRYPLSQLQTLKAEYSEDPPTGRLQFSAQQGGESFLIRSRFMPEIGWTLRILTDAKAVDRQAWQATTLAVLVALLLAMVAALILGWRGRQLRRLKEQEEVQHLLETRVAERTKDLEREIHERIQAEDELRKMQQELVRAGKMAALGQMSAALSHELNQPLAAVKTYADNALTLLDRGRIDEAKDNLARISDLTDRMAQISKSLRNFARKPRDQIGSVRLADVLGDVEQIMAGRLHQDGAVLAIDTDKPDYIVIGGHVRLQQVLVNLINNALDAMAGQADKTVSILVRDRQDKVEISVRDHGPGIDQDIFEKIFDPFFTTKGVNQGLGLGLSISFNILRDFGGDLRAENHPDGGAIFTLTLVKAKMHLDSAT